MKLDRAVWPLLFISLLFAAQISAQPAADQFNQMRPKPRALFEKWAAKQASKDGRPTDARKRFLDLPVSRRSVFAAITNALLFTKLTDPAGKQFGSAIDLVDSIDSIAGDEEGKGGDERFRLYVTLKPGSLEKLDVSREFVHGKNNTVFHKGFPINYRQNGTTPTLQFSIATDHVKADIDIDYKSSGFPAALFNGHLSTANSDVRASGNYPTHLRRWPGLIDWWDDVVPDPVFELRRSRSSVPVNLVAANHSEFAPESSIVSGEAAKFFKAWLVDKSPESAVGYLAKTINFCGDLERTTNATSLSARNRQLLIETMRAANKEVKKANALKDAIHPVAPVDPYIKAIDHENKDAFTLAVFTDGDERHFVCSAKTSELTASAGETRPPKYGGNYVTKFRFALENGKGGILRLLWKRDGDAWRIGAFDAVVA